MARMTADDFVKKLIDTATKHKTLYVMGCFGAPMTPANKERYCNNHAYNKQPARTAMIKAASENTFGFDCVCLIKGILWGWNGDNQKIYGGAAYRSSGVLDIGEDKMITLCSEVSEDFSNVPIGSMLWLKGHCGVYIGDGLAVECTPKWGNCVQVTAVGNIGKKSGYPTRTWTKHGKLPYIDYADEKGEAIEVGSKVKVRQGARSYTGNNLASFVFENIYDVLQIEGNRAVIGIDGKITAAMRLEDLILQQHIPPEVKEESQMPDVQSKFRPYTVVINYWLNIRSGPGTNHKKIGRTRYKGVYTIVEKSKGRGATLWGRLANDEGWIALDNTKKNYYSTYGGLTVTFLPWKIKKIWFEPAKQPLERIDDAYKRIDCDWIFNANMFNMKTGETEGHVMSKGVWLSKNGNPFGYGFVGNKKPVFSYENNVKAPDFIGSYPCIVRNGAIEKGLSNRGVRGRMAMGMSGDEFKVRAIPDNTLSPRKTVYGMGREMIDLGCENAINLDGGGSVAWIGPGTSNIPSRLLDGFVCVDVEDEGPSPETSPQKPATKPAPAQPAAIKVGSKVKVKAGARTYTGGRLASFVYRTTYDVQHISGDRVVIGLKGKVTAAVRLKDLILQ